MIRGYDRILASCLVFFVLIAPVSAIAQTNAWPQKPIRWIVPYPAGGGADLMARVIGSHLEKSLGQPVIIENRGGASTIAGTASLAQANADGYTVGMVFDSLAINLALGTATSYDAKSDFVPIIHLADVPLLFLVNAEQVTMKTLPEVVAYSKENPKWFSFGTTGPGGPHEIGFLWFKALSKMDAVAVPYRGTSPALQDVLAGQVKGMFLGVGIADEHIRAGKLRLLGVSPAKRLPSAPDVLTIAEQGYPEFDYVTFYGLAAPKGTPAEIVERLNAEINRILQLREVRAKLEPTGVTLTGGNRKHFEAFIANNFAKFRHIVDISGAKDAPPK